MKKTLLLALLFALLYLGSSYFLGKMSKDSYEEFLTQLQGTKKIDISKSKYEQGLFSSSVELELNIHSDIYAGEAQNMQLATNFSIKHNLISAFLDWSASGEIEFINEPFKSSVQALFSGTPTSWHANFLKQRFRLELGEMQNKIAGFFASGVFVELDLDEGFVESIALGFSELKQNDMFLSLNLSELQSLMSFKEKISLLEINKAFNSESKASLKAASFKSFGESLDIKELSWTTSSSAKDNRASQLWLAQIKDLAFGQNAFTSLKLDFALKDFDTSKLLRIINLPETALEDLPAVQKELFGLLSSGALIEIKELSLKNDKGHEAKLELIAGLNASKEELQSQEDLLSKAFFQGQAKVQKGLGAFIYKNKEIALLESELLSKNVLVKQGEDSICSFKYDSNKQDILLNDKTWAGEIR